MSQEDFMTINIQGMALRLKCPVEQRQALQTSVQYLDEQLQAAKDAGSRETSDRLLMLTALNLTNELLTLRGQAADFESARERMMALQAKVEGVLSNVSSPDLQ